MAFTPLNALNAFLAVARRKSFANAAARPRRFDLRAESIRSPARGAPGVALLARTSRSVALTDAGQRLLEPPTCPMFGGASIDAARRLDVPFGWAKIER